MESVITNSEYLAEVIEKEQCTTREKIERILEDEVKGKYWDEEVRGFEQHMEEESKVMIDWEAGEIRRDQIEVQQLWRQTCMGWNPCLLPRGVQKAYQCIADVSTRNVGRHKCSTSRSGDGESCEAIGNKQR